MASHNAGFFLHVARIPENILCRFCTSPFFFKLQPLFFCGKLEGPGNSKIRQRKSFVEISFTSSSAAEKGLNSELIFDHFLWSSNHFSQLPHCLVVTAHGM